MIYKVIPGPKQVSGDPVDAATAFASIINAEAANGWKYHSMETITSVPKPGCGKPTAPVTSFMLIFEKDE